MSLKQELVIGKSEILENLGETLIQNGYNIVPIPTGTKSPGFDGWQDTVATGRVLKGWIDNGYGDAGVGILTKNSPAVDLDIRDTEVAQRMEDWCHENLGFTPVRVGNHPKRLLVFKTDEPFRKMKSGKFVDEWGDEHEVEILASGQQFVAYGIHKDTHKPYTWTSVGASPELTELNDLPNLNKADAQKVIDEFIRVATELGWERKTRGMTGEVSPIDSEDDPFADFESVVDIETVELRNRLMIVQGAEDYDRWIQVGMALYHQFGGEDTGLELWHEWSETADNYDGESLDKHWKSFEIEGKKRSPVTARTILKFAKEAATTATLAKITELRDKFVSAKDEMEWREVCAQVRKAEIDSLARAQMVEIARKRYQDLTSYKLPLVEARRSLAYEMPNSTKTPKWCHDWVYDAQDDKFFHVRTKITMTMQGFNAVYSRNAMTKKDLLDGLDSPSSSPSALALNVYKIPEIYGRYYAPGMDEIYMREGLRVGNLYREYQIPEVPDELTPGDKKAIKRVKNHVAHLLDDPDEQALFIDWLAWLVQNPGKLMNWAMVLQGVQGDGKSFFAYLLRNTMGHSNVRIMNGKTLENDFSGWSYGQCVTVIEEPRLIGQNRYDTINKIKTFITNPVIEVHAKGKDPFTVENTSSYYLPTNFRDALPLHDDERRYGVLFSKWQNRDDLIAFNRANPNYYVELYETIRDHTPALRKWLVEHEISESFPGGKDAPITRAYRYMVKASKPDIILEIESIIEEGKFHEISEELLNATMVLEVLSMSEIELPSAKALSYMLENNGYTALGRFKTHNNTRRDRFWSKKPNMFRDGQEFSGAKIRRYIEQKSQDEEL